MQSDREEQDDLASARGAPFFRSARLFEAFGVRALDAILPPICPATGETVDRAAHLSASAWAQMKFIADPVCARCGAPFAHEMGEGAECGACIAEPPDFDRARAAVVYDAASHKLIAAFKYSDRTDLAPMLAKWMTAAGREMASPDMLVAPVPMHGRRLFARRFNQAALLAQAISKTVGSEFAPTLFARIRPTPPQASLSAVARRRNLAGAIIVRRKFEARIAGRRILLIDDVLTTGTTLSACAKAAKRAGAGRVEALVLARVIKGGAALG